MAIDTPTPGWWGKYLCNSCEDTTRASSLPPYCPHCGDAGFMSVVESAKHPNA